MTTYTPEYFTVKQGGRWELWTFGPVDEAFLRGRNQQYLYWPHSDGMTTERIQVHAFKFQDSTYWDCINGWRTSSKQSKPAIISRRVTRYETPDGRQHDTLTEARKHQIKCDLYNVIKHDEHLAVRDVNTLHVVDLLCYNAAELSQLLRRFMQLEQIKVSKPEGVKPA